jgi:excinuclease ABC subunit A
LRFLTDVGLGYLSLDRASRTLSGGESQRIRLATQIGSKLVNVLYILDEPSIGLHQRDNERLINTLKALHSSAGRQVGIISHREEIRENIPVQIKVNASTGSSASTVEVVEVIQ